MRNRTAVEVAARSASVGSTPHNVEVVGLLGRRRGRERPRRSRWEVGDELHPPGTRRDLAEGHLHDVRCLDRVVHRREVHPRGCEVSTGRHHGRATGDGRQCQHDARCTADIADQRDAASAEHCVGAPDAISTAHEANARGVGLRVGASHLYAGTLATEEAEDADLGIRGFDVEAVAAERTAEGSRPGCSGWVDVAAATASRLSRVGRRCRVSTHGRRQGAFPRPGGNPR